uniref:Malate dehydrogenase, FAD/NAD(P)-binding domain n=1 Tax=mine drainage metagenome TaxID=410659 RepID=E6PD95_9ZZZZ
MLPKRHADVVVVGAGIIGATFAAILKELRPELSVELFEALDSPARESTGAWNNAGTGHAALCELNYTPQNADGSIGIARALAVNTQFDLSRQFWAYMVRKGAIGPPESFIHSVPHITFVWGDENVRFLRKRFEAMSAHHCFRGIEYSEDHTVLERWMPLVMEGRSQSQRVAATRITAGTDVDYGALTRQLLAHIQKIPGVNVAYSTRVTDLKRTPGNGWEVSVRDTKSGATNTVSASAVFLGAGGGTLSLLQRSGIKEGKGFGGFPVSGVFLRCDDEAIVERHFGKVYGKASVGTVPIGLPHLDTRFIDGKRSLLFGPYAEFTTKFLKHGSYGDFLRSIRNDNIKSMFAAGRDNFELTTYLIGEVIKSKPNKYAFLRDYFPKADPTNWTFIVAGQRVQVIMPDAERGGRLQFGTAIVSDSERSLGAVLGASPGASVSVAVVLDIVNRLYASSRDEWKTHLSEMIPSYGLAIAEDAALCDGMRAEIARVLNLEHIPSEHTIFKANPRTP